MGICVLWMSPERWAHGERRRTCTTGLTGASEERVLQRTWREETDTIRVILGVIGRVLAWIYQLC